MNMRTWLRSAALLLPLGTMAQTPPQTAAMHIRILIGERSLAATLDDSATARDFAALLPLSLTLQDYARTEKISDLPRRLATTGAPAGTTPRAGDLAYYAPWGNLAIFYKDFGHSAGLVRLGRLAGDVGALAGPGPLAVRIERAER